MKTSKYYVFFFTILSSFSAIAQNDMFGDDVYSSPKNKKITVQTVATNTQEPTVIITTSTDKEVDKYNRRYSDSDISDTDINKDVADTINESATGELTQRIVRFHDPSKITIVGADNVNLRYDGKIYEIDFDEPNNQISSVSIVTRWYGNYYPQYYYSNWYTWRYNRYYFSWYYDDWYNPWYYGRYRYYHYLPYYTSNYHYKHYNRNSNYSRKRDFSIKNSGSQPRSSSVKEYRKSNDFVRSSATRNNTNNSISVKENNSILRSPRNNNNYTEPSPNNTQDNYSSDNQSNTSSSSKNSNHDRNTRSSGNRSSSNFSRENNNSENYRRSQNRR